MLDKCKHHLHSVHETYCEHLFFAVWFGFKMIGAGLAVIIHALCPALFQQTGSRTIFQLHDLLKSRSAHKHD